MVDRRQPGRARTSGALLGGAAMAAAAAVALVGDGAPAAARSAGAAYTCAVESPVFPPGLAFAADLSGSATAPATVDIGQAAALTDVAVAAQFDPAEIGNLPDVAGTGDLGPDGQADLGLATMDEQGLLAYTGGTGSVTGDGATGEAMAVTLDQLTVVAPSAGPGSPPFLTLRCTPVGAPVTLATIGLTGEPPSTVPPSTVPPTTPTTSTTSGPGAPTGLGAVRAAPPATPVAGQPTFTG